MNHRTLAALAGLIAWLGIGDSIAHAQVWRLGTYGPGQRSSVFPNRPQFGLNQPLGNAQAGMFNIQPDGTYKLGLTPPGATGMQPDVITTGHPVTHFNYQKFFPLGYGTTSGTNITAVGITGVGGVIGLGQGTTGGTGMAGITGLQQGLNANQFGTLQRSRMGSGR